MSLYSDDNWINFVPISGKNIISVWKMHDVFYSFLNAWKCKCFSLIVDYMMGFQWIIPRYRSDRMWRYSRIHYGSYFPLLKTCKRKVWMFPRIIYWSFISYYYLFPKCIVLDLKTIWSNLEPFCCCVTVKLKNLIRSTFFISFCK